MLSPETPEKMREDLSGNMSLELAVPDAVAVGASLHSGLPWKNTANIEQRPIWTALGTPVRPCGLPTVRSWDCPLVGFSINPYTMCTNDSADIAPATTGVAAGTQDAQTLYRHQILHYHPCICLFY